MIPERADIPDENKWKVEEMYLSEDLWEKDLTLYSSKDSFKPLLAHQGKLGENAEHLEETLNLLFDIDRVLEKLYTYAHLRFDEDLGNDSHKKAYSRIQSIYHEFQLASVWIEPELLSIKEEDFQKICQSEKLKKYHTFLHKISRMREHTLTEKEEALVALSAKALSTSQKTFSAFNNADMKFNKAVDSEGKEHELSQGLFSAYLKSTDRVLRKSAFENIHQAYLDHENTLAEVLGGQVQTHIFMARAKNYSSSLEAALYPHQIDLTVYTNLIDSVKRRKDVLHKYISLRKRLLGVDSLHLYDLYVPLVEEESFHMEYADAKDLILEAFQPLGEEYVATLAKGLGEQRWVDVYENKKKRSGAYSSGCYDSFPYILMNYNGTLNDVFTLAHEAGHSMHSFLSHKHQSFVDAQYPIFVAEVASTFNEQLLLQTLLKKAKSKREKAFLINHAIDGIRATLFRQTLFADFELKIHEWAEKGIPLTPTFLKEEYRKLNAEYYGEDLAVGEYADIEWARIPHFYYNFYVYQYATGISAALALVDGAVKDSGKRARYLEFLSSGGSKFPIDLLKLAGVDMNTPAPVLSAIDHFEMLVDELALLLDEEGSVALEKGS